MLKIQTFAANPTASKKRLDRIPPPFIIDSSGSNSLGRCKSSTTLSDDFNERSMGSKDFRGNPPPQEERLSKASLALELVRRHCQRQIVCTAASQRQRGKDITPQTCCHWPTHEDKERVLGKEYKQSDRRAAVLLAVRYNHPCKLVHTKKRRGAKCGNSTALKCWFPVL